MFMLMCLSVYDVNGLDQEATVQISKGKTQPEVAAFLLYQRGMKLYHSSENAMVKRKSFLSVPTSLLS